jgi:hypothetical protein
MISPRRASAKPARATSLADRVAQTVVMMRSADALGWKTTDPDEIAIVRARFVRLHALLGAGR